MYTYNLIQWLMFFYTYCFFGWCFESTYVSLKKRKLVNRGFLNGPYLPLYGSGAISVLFAALPFRENPVWVYVVGALTATLLEYVTGVVMEAVFKVRYWDYSSQKFNFQGHICLSSTIAWGFLSLAMVFGFHKPVEGLIFSFKPNTLNLIVLIVSVAMAADCAVSFKAAFEFREVLAKLQGLKEELRIMQKRLEVIEAVLNDEGKQRLEHIEQALEERREQKEQKREERREQIEQLKEELAQLKEKQLIYKDRIKGHTNVRKLKTLFGRNPSVISKKYNEIFEELRERLKEN
ncbi:MAG: hypothetical protein NC412_09030 [Roseburia sp.]|nr:hypothetical protein [Roseburia sp.]MCM1277553.1 hypothetical protein [Robinsoniella sp.]